MAKKSRRILIIDDEASIRDGCSQILERAGHEVESTGDAEYGLKLAMSDRFDVILLDIRLPKIEGIEILRILKKEQMVQARIIVITGYGSIPLAVEAMRLGAVNFLTKPFGAAELRGALNECFAEAADESSEDSLGMLIGSSDYMRELKETIRRVSKTDSSVLITGESGTGKELVARTIHNLSRRSGMPFVAVDCSSLVPNLMESELFGHVKGAFSGAYESRQGRFQVAHRGTLFLDEISNISLDIQAKLLRVVQEQEVPRVGSSKPEKVDVRLITATNRDLRAEVESGRFREDLFYRISVVPMHIRPLREHRTDIMDIARHYLEIYRERHGAKVRRFSIEAIQSLNSYSWPGNVRELKNTVERLCVLCDHEEVTLSDIMYYGQDPRGKAPVVDPFSGRMRLVDVERDHIEKALRHFNFHMNKTAQFLGIDRKTLRLKIRTYGIKTPGNNEKEE
ncbi:MAG TPA: sigma-54 dependent transcriptional regulator [Deltaproteobacteria bacterium]|nr:sigma-54 dependent transcriptional regulator [Deltaproteobacteria bacterium]HPP79789.1 sigma-54 dependent transcriptional regulator [Deltaproteobacteria bacterium]